MVITKLRQFAAANRCVRCLHDACATGVAPSAGVDSPVLIAGAGPAGLSLAMWLARYGIKSTVLERRVQLSKHPQAHYINNRTMEVLRPLWGLAAHITSHTPPLDHWRTFRYGYSMTGALLGEVDHFPGQAVPRQPQVSPEPVAHLPQSKLVPMMMDRVLRLPHLVTVRQGLEVCGLGTHARGVWVQARDQTGMMHKIHGSYLVAADGANSLIRSQLNIGMDGSAVMQNIINIHFTSPHLGRLLLRPPQHTASSSSQAPWGQPVSAPGQRNSQAAMLYFVFNREVVGVVVAHDLANGEFVAHVPFFPPTQSPDEFTPPRCMHIISQAAGLPLTVMPDLAIHHVRPWIMSARVADKYHVGSTSSGNPPSPPTHPRVFLIGDAAHSFPPAGGFGMNTGIQDAHNLAWKLALVLQSGQGQVSGDATTGLQPLINPAHLLTSYEVERRPVAVSNRDLSVRNWNEATAVPAALGLAPAAADMLQDVISAVPFLPSSARQGLLERGLAAGRAASMTWNPLRPLQLAHIKTLFESGVTLRMQFPQEDLGFRYPTAAAAAVAPDDVLIGNSSSSAGDKQQVAAGSASHATTRAAPYQPSCMPGCRLPHVWLRLVKPDAAMSHTSTKASTGAAGASTISPQPPAGCVSTQDVVAGVTCPPAQQDGADTTHSAVLPWMVLFTDHHNSHSNPWLEALQSLQGSSDGHLPVSAVQVLQEPSQVAGKEITGRWQCMEDVDGVWHHTMQLPVGSAVLVRPDGHVAWKHGHVDGAATAAKLLQTALKRILSSRTAL